MIEGGWSLSEVENADYDFLLTLFAEGEQNNSTTADGFDFIAQFLSPDELAELHDKE